MSWSEQVTRVSGRLVSPRTARLASKVASKQLQLVRERVVSELEGRRDRATYDSVDTYAFFLGFPRSGHTLAGAMLNSHPEMVMAHEVDAFRLVQAGASRNGLFRALLRGDERFAAAGWKWQGYEYEIAGQWQGRWTSLRVIGDKKGEGSTVALRDDPALLGKLKKVVGVPVRAIVIVRNPYDNIARMAIKSKTRLLGSIWSYSQLLEVVDATLADLGDDAALVIRHEQLVHDPIDALEQMTGFLGVPCSEEWAKSAVSIVFDSPRLARNQIEWSSGERAVVEELIERSPLLRGYRFDD